MGGFVVALGRGSAVAAVQQEHRLAALLRATSRHVLQSGVDKEHF